MKNKLYFAKVRPDAKIPAKKDEDAGYDIYPCFDDDFLIIPYNETVLVPTGIASAISPGYYAQIEERGSTGSIGMKKSAGVIDSGYRGEWFIAITNCSFKDIIISKLSMEELAGGKPIDETLCVKLKDEKGDTTFLGCETIVYPYEKAIAQAVIHEVPMMEVEEISYEELKIIPSERGSGKLGSTGK